MADTKEKPKSRGEKRYGSSPKITDKKPAGGDTDKSGHEEADAAKAKGTAGEEHGGTVSDGGAAPKATEDAGTAGIPVHEVHTRERGDMMKRQRGEMKDMHDRHADEYGKMMSRHDKEIGKAGTEPEGGE